MLEQQYLFLFLFKHWNTAHCNIKNTILGKIDTNACTFMVKYRLVWQELPLTHDQHEVIKTVLKYEQCENDVEILVAEVSLKL